MAWTASQACFDRQGFPGAQQPNIGGEVVAGGGRWGVPEPNILAGNRCWGIERGLHFVLGWGNRGPSRDQGGTGHRPEQEDNGGIFSSCEGGGGGRTSSIKGGDFHLTDGGEGGKFY